MPKPSREDYTSGLSATALKPLAAVIYAAAADQDDKMMQYVGSTLLNRLESGKEEFGAETGDINKVIHHPGAYYEKNSKLYDDFLNNNFQDERSKKAAIRAASIASALSRGTLDRMPGEFWFNEEERNKFKKNPKAFNLSLVEELGDIGVKKQFKMYGYPKAVKTDAQTAMNDFGFSDVREFQKFLADNGQNPGALDGQYGKKTHQAYLALKKSVGKR